jgi:hypothetical protein
MSAIEGVDMTFKTPDGDRWYRDVSNPTKSWPGVTSILNTRYKAGIEKAKLSAAVLYLTRQRKLESFQKMTQADIVAFMKNEDVYLPDWKTARDFGTACHQVIENIINDVSLDTNVKWVQGSDKYPVSNTFIEWLPVLWGQFVRKHSVRVLLSEQVVISDTHRFAGRFDLIVEMDFLDGLGPQITILDIKTNKNGPHGDVAIQNTAYAKSDYIMLPDGSHDVLPKITRSAVFWTHENAPLSLGVPVWNCYPLRYDDTTWRTWYALLLAHRFTVQGEHNVIGEGLNGEDKFTRWQPR